MKQYMANHVRTDEIAQRPIGALPAGSTKATVVLTAMSHPAPTGLVQVTGQKQRHGEGE